MDDPAGLMGALSDAAYNEQAPKLAHCGIHKAHKLHTWFDGDSGGVDRRCTGLTSDAPQPKRNPHKAQRGSDVEAWLKVKRDEFPEDGDGYALGARTLIDSLLDEYRLRADHGLRMGDDIPEGVQ